jgi:hypothetical protein
VWSHSGEPPVNRPTVAVGANEIVTCPSTIQHKHFSLKMVSRLATVVLLVAMASSSFALTCTSVSAGGKWHDSATWTDCGEGTPGPDDVASIGGGASLQGDVTIDSGTSAVQVAALTINSGRLYNKGAIVGAG